MARPGVIRGRTSFPAWSSVFVLLGVLSVAGVVSGLDPHRELAFVLSRGIAPFQSSITTRARPFQATSVRPGPRAHVTPVASTPAAAHMSVSTEESDTTLIPAPEGDSAALSLQTATPSSAGEAVQHAVEGAAAAAATTGGIAAKKVVEALPGTWLTAGLPKWMHTLRRRMITKEDYLHLHAASGVVSRCAVSWLSLSRC